MADARNSRIRQIAFLLVVVSCVGVARCPEYDGRKGTRGDLYLAGTAECYMAPDGNDNDPGTLLLASVGTVGGVVPRPAGDATAIPAASRPEGRYHCYDEIVTGLYELTASGIAHAEVLGSTAEGREILAVKISDNPIVDENEPALLFLGCHHAREWMAAEVPYFLARDLVGRYDVDPEVQRLVDQCEVWIVPVVNPDGFEYSRTVDPAWRKNRRDNGDGTFGVDLSRNYGHMWGHGPWSSADTSNENYRGPCAFSEPETQAVRDLALRCDLEFFISYHSYGQLVLYPWGCTEEPAPDACLLAFIAGELVTTIRGVHGQVYVAAQTAKRAGIVGGAETDWGYAALGVPSFGIELRPASAEEGGFILPVEQIIPTCEENVAAALFLMSCALDPWPHYIVVDDDAVNDPAPGDPNVSDPNENGSPEHPFDAIQEAVLEAVCGDTVLVLPGRYTGQGNRDIDPQGKAVTIRGASGPQPCVIDCEGLGRGFVFHSGEGPQTLVEGLTIRNGYADSGGAIYCAGASRPTIAHCILERNTAAMFGGALYSPDGNPTLTNCTFHGNSARFTGGAIFSSYGTVTVGNSILWGDRPDEIVSIGQLVVTHSDVQGAGWPGEGNMDVDPLFADPDSGNYHLKSQAGRWDPLGACWLIDPVTSPCIDAGDPNAPVADEPQPNGGRINMGAYGGTPEASLSPPVGDTEAN